jgi:hypothetical protein
MATQFPTVSEAITAHPHDVALPYRGDGVAWALRQTYQPDEHHLPLDMLCLLAAIDEPLVVSDPGLAP